MKKEKTFYFRQDIRKLDISSQKAMYLLFKHAEKIYNEALYLSRQYYDKEGKYCGYVYMIDRLSESQNFKILGNKISVSIIRNLDINYKNYFKSIAAKKYCNAPGYRNANTSFFISIFSVGITNNDYITIPLTVEFRTKYGFEDRFFLKIEVAKRFLSIGIRTIKQVRVQRDTKKGLYYLVYHYTQEVEQAKKIPGRALGIDFGGTNLLSCYSNKEGSRPFIIKGGHVKYINHQAFKRLNKDMQRSNFELSQKMIDRMTKRSNKIDKYYDRIAKYITLYCMKNGIENVYVGAFLGIKNQERALNRTFVRIPYLRLRLKLKDKLNAVGIEIYFIDESYTSKTSFIDEETPFKHSEYEGKRKKRGLFCSKDGKLINADINGAAQILIKGGGKVSNRKNVLISPKILKH